MVTCMVTENREGLANGLSYTQFNPLSLSQISVIESVVLIVPAIPVVVADVTIHPTTCPGISRSSPSTTNLLLIAAVLCLNLASAFLRLVMASSDEDSSFSFCKIAASSGGWFNVKSCTIPHSRENIKA